MTSDPLRNNVDDSFIEELNQHISNEAVSILIQDYIKKLVIHEVDVITDSDWFDCKINDTVEDLKKMIDNPLENQTLETLDGLYINEKFEEHCSATAKELAKDYNLNPDYYEPFIEFYIEECRESDRGYFFGNQKYIIDLWWDHNKYLYETKTPYMEIRK